jgi:adenylyltransferase/sulfurtransferase
MMLDKIRGLASRGLRQSARMLPANDNRGLQVVKWMLEASAQLLLPGVPAAIPTSPAHKQAAQAESAPPIVEAQELLAMLGGEAPPLVVDVRDPRETQTGVIPAARLIPLAEVLAAIGELREAGRPVVVYCAHGMRSANIVTHLRDRGVDAHTLIGGIEAWRTVGGAIEPPPA